MKILIAEDKMPVLQGKEGCDGLNREPAFLRGLHLIMDAVFVIFLLKLLVRHGGQNTFCWGPRRYFLLRCSLWQGKVIKCPKNT